MLRKLCLFYKTRLMPHVIVYGRGESGKSQSSDNARLDSCSQSNESSSNATSIGTVLPVTLSSGLIFKENKLFRMTLKLKRIPAYRFDSALNRGEHQSNNGKVFSVAKCGKFQIAEDLSRCLLFSIRSCYIWADTGAK